MWLCVSQVYIYVYYIKCDQGSFINIFMVIFRKDDPIQGRMYVFPVEKTVRWGQMLMKPSLNGGELWVLTQTMKDARNALKKVPDDFDPSVVSRGKKIM